MRSARFVSHISAQNLEPLTRRARACRRAPTERIRRKIRFSRNDVVTANAAGGFASQRGGGRCKPCVSIRVQSSTTHVIVRASTKRPERARTFARGQFQERRSVRRATHALSRACPGARGAADPRRCPRRRRRRSGALRSPRQTLGRERERDVEQDVAAGEHSFPDPPERVGALRALHGGLERVRRRPTRSPRPNRMSVGRARGSCTRTTSPPARTPSPTPLSVWARCERCAGGWDARGGGRTGSPPNVGRPRAGEVGARDVSAGVHSFPEPPERLQALRARHRAMGRARRPPDAFPPTFGRPQAG